MVSPVKFCCVPLASHAVGTSASEVDNDVRRTDQRGVLVRRNAEIEVAVEGGRIERPVEGDLRAALDVRRKPVLPDDAAFDVHGLGAGALSLHIVEPLKAPGDVVERVGL